MAEKHFFPQGSYVWWKSSHASWIPAEITSQKLDILTLRPLLDDGTPDPDMEVSPSHHPRSSSIIHHDHIIVHHRISDPSHIYFSSISYFKTIRLKDIHIWMDGDQMMTTSGATQCKCQRSGIAPIEGSPQDGG